MILHRKKYEEGLRQYITYYHFNPFGGGFKKRHGIFKVTLVVAKPNRLQLFEVVPCALIYTTLAIASFANKNSNMKKCKKDKEINNPQNRGREQSSMHVISILEDFLFSAFKGPKKLEND